SVHGTGGPIKLIDVLPEHPLTAAFLAACEERGFPRSADFNSLDAEGFGLNQLNMWDGRREDAGSIFLNDAFLRAHEKVAVLLNATATRLRFDTSGSRVTDCEYVQDGARKSIKVHSEVILAA